MVSGERGDRAGPLGDNPKWMINAGASIQIMSLVSYHFSILLLFIYLFPNLHNFVPARDRYLTAKLETPSSRLSFVPY